MFHIFPGNMRCSTLKGFLVILLIQQCTSEGVATSIQSPTEVTHQDGQTLPQEPEVPAAEVVPVVSPPSLKDVQQAVQEASEQVESRGAEEVLKELLERVVEAALGKAEEASEAKDITAEQEVAEEDALGAQAGESEAEAEEEVLEQPSEDVTMESVEEHTGLQEPKEVAEEEAFEHVAGEEKGAVQEDGETAADETAAGSVEKPTEVVETGVIDVEGLEIVKESLGTEFSQEDTDGEETEGALEAEGAGEAGDEDHKEQPVLSEEKNETETAIEDAEETLAAVEVAVGGQIEQKTVEGSEPSLIVVDEEQIGNDWEKEVSPKEETQTDEKKNGLTVLPSNDYEVKTTQPVVGEPIEEEEAIETGTEETEEEDEDSLLVEGGTEEEVEEGTDLGVKTEDEDDIIKEDSVTMVDEGGDKKVGEDALEDSHGSVKEDQEILVISGPQPEDGAEASIEQSPENQPPTSKPPLAEVESRENTLGHERSDRGNKFIIPTLDPSPHDPADAQPTMDSFENEALAEHPQAEGEEPGEANELVEDISGTRETSGEQDLEAWKIGAIFAAVFLVMETVVIIVYILKCRTKKSAPALQRTCEEGCVEPEAATGGDCSDDTLPAGNGDAQQIAVLNPSGVASTLAKQKEQQEDEHAIAMSDLPPRSTEEGANSGPGPDSSQDLTTQSSI